MNDSTVDTDSRNELVKYSPYGGLTLFDLVEPLQSERSQKLLYFCKSLKLPENDARWVELTARMVRDFELIKSSLPTPKARLENLKNILKFSLTLSEAIEQVDIHDLLKLMEEMAAVPADIMSAAESQRNKYGPAAGVGVEARRLSIALKTFLAKQPEVKKGGRAPMVHHYVRFIEDDLEPVDYEAGITLGRGGKFEELCTAVFEAAGVPAGAEGALRAYLELKKWRKNNPPPPYDGTSI